MSTQTCTNIKQLDYTIAEVSEELERLKMTYLAKKVEYEATILDLTKKRMAIKTPSLVQADFDRVLPDLY